MTYTSPLPVISATCIWLYALAGTGCQCGAEPAPSDVTRFEQPGDVVPARHPPLPDRSVAAVHGRSHHNASAFEQLARPAATLAPAALSSAPLARHVRQATTVRFTQLHDSASGDARRLEMWTLTDRRDVARVLSAIGVHQRPTDAECAPCPGATRIVLEGSTGLHLAEVQLDCAPTGGADALVRLGAHPVCGRLPVRDRAALTDLIARARTANDNHQPLAMP